MLSDGYQCNIVVIIKKTGYRLIKLYPVYVSVKLFNLRFTSFNKA